MGEARRMQQMGNMRPLRPGEQIQIDLKNATPKVCKCGSILFMPAVKCFTVSALMSPTGQELMAQQPVLVCMDCKAVLS